MNEISDKNSMLLNDVIKNNFGSIETSGQLRDANQKVESDSKMDMLMRFDFDFIKKMYKLSFSGIVKIFQF
jgi:hypothetical protein